MAKKSDVKSGLDPDLFNSGLDFDDEDDADAAEDESTDSWVDENADEDGDSDDGGAEGAEDSVEEAEEEPEGESDEEEEDSDEGVDEVEDESDSEDQDDSEEDSSESDASEDSFSEDEQEEAAAEDDLGEIESETYVVQRGFTGPGGKTFVPGDVIPIKCKYCALWKQEWLGKVRCSPGRTFGDGSVMSAERYSCETFFIPMELDAELKNYLNMSLLEVVAVRQMLTGMRKILETAEWLQNWSEKNEYDADLNAVFKTARGFVMAFDSVEQLDYVESFLREYSKSFSKRLKEKRPPRPKFNGGDWVEWTDLKTQMRYEGIVLSKGRGKILIAGVKAQQGTKFSFDFKEWKKKRNPRVTRQSAEA